MLLAAHGPASGTRLPGAESGACVAGPCSPWPPPLAPPAPHPVAWICSPASWLLWRSPTSLVRASSASAPRLPDADRRQASLAAVGQEISRFPNKERMYMPGSLTSPDWVGTRDFAPSHVAFRVCDHVGTRIKNISRLNGWPVHTPVNASLYASRPTAHDSGTIWFANPLLSGTFTLYSLPVSRRTTKIQTGPARRLLCDRGQATKLELSSVTLSFFI